MEKIDGAGNEVDHVVGSEEGGGAGARVLVGVEEDQKLHVLGQRGSIANG